MKTSRSELKKPLASAPGLSGGCLCAHIRFEAMPPAYRPHACSCKMCQRHTGALTIVWVEFPSTAVRWTGPGGEPARYRSSAGSSRAFCPKCGSTLGAIDDKPTVALVVGTFDAPISKMLLPVSHAFRSSAPRWWADAVLRLFGNSKCPANSVRQTGQEEIAVKTQTKFGTFDELLDLATEPMRPVLMRLRAIVLEIHPTAVQVVRLGERSATFGVGPSKMTEAYGYLLPHRKWVNLGFYKGADLEDPKKLLEGTGAKLRHIKVQSMAEANNPDIRDMIKAALAERTMTLGK
jgi:hypothetical protein